MKTKRSFFFVC